MISFSYSELEDLVGLKSSLSQTLWLILGPIFIIVVGLHILESRQADPREPPLIRTYIPYIGHLVGILSYGSAYFKSLGRKNAGSIFALPMPGSRLYIVTDPSLAASVQRASKALSFSPLVPPILQRVAGFDAETIELMKSDMESGYIQQVQNVVHARLSQGQYLDEVSLAACNEFAKRLKHFKETQLSSSGHYEDLLAWTKNLVTEATATFFYGPDNPVEKDPSLVHKFWNFDAGIPGLLLGIFPQWTARQAYLGREAVVKALSDYMLSPEYSQAANITRERTQIGQDLGVKHEAIARSDLTFFFAGIINTSLTSFWMIVNIFARKNLLSDIQAELDSVLEESGGASGRPRLSIKKLSKDCPMLYAVFKEVLRLYSDNFATRVVQEDTILADRYFLRKHSIVQVSGGIIHADKNIWGEDVGEFRPERHLSNVEKTKANMSLSESRVKSVHPAAFRAFGGGATLCPGRHFAVNEILALVAMVVLHFDLDDQRGQSIRIPAKIDNVLPIHVLEPRMAVPVRFRVRQGRCREDLTLDI